MRDVTVPTRKIFFVIVWFIFSLNCHAQKEAKLYETADNLFKSKRFNEALIQFQEVKSINPTYLDLEYKMEICSLLTRVGEQKSLKDYLNMQSVYEEKDDHYFYWLGKIYAHRYKLDKAINAFEKFHQRVTMLGIAHEEDTQELIAHSLRLKTFFNNPDDYEIHQLEIPVNSKFAELSPVYFEEGNELLFASNRTGRGDQPFKVYYTKKNGSSWTPLKQVTSIGQFSRKNANLEVVNKDGKLFTFSDEKGGDLFYSLSLGDEWTKPREFDSKVSNNHLASHFFINEHEDRIIFASDMNGNLDLFESFKDANNGKWSKPKPFFNSINSEYIEDSPYLSPDEMTLYFCSDRPGGLGGLDVYVSHYDTLTLSWSEPENMGWPINSPDDEFHFKMNSEQVSGYFVSNRLHTNGDYDIYFFWHIDKVMVEGTVYDKRIKAPITDAEIRFHPSLYLDEYFRSTIDHEGRYHTKIISDEIFKVEIIKDGDVIYTENMEFHADGKLTTTHLLDFKIN